MLVCDRCQTEATEVLDDTPKIRCTWSENELHNCYKVQSCLLEIGNISRAIYRLGY
jgi:hypothetical protein